MRGQGQGKREGKVMRYAGRKTQKRTNTRRETEQCPKQRDRCEDSNIERES